jgi:hypothetical protein
MQILSTCVAVTEHCNRKTVVISDVGVLSLGARNLSANETQVIFALRREGRPIYGFDPDTYSGAKKK